MMKQSYSTLVLYSIIITIFLAVAFSTSALEGGHGDLSSEGSQCLTCHTSGPEPGLGTGYDSITIGSAQPIIRFKVRVNMATIEVASSKFGVMLVTSEHGNLTDDGWVMSGDPNGNSPPRNYIERPSSDNNILQWTMTNSPGHYIVRVLILFGSQDVEYVWSKDVNVNITGPFENTPPELRNPKAFPLSDNRTYDFEVTYVDRDGDYPRNITVNISGLGSFEMQPRTMAPYDFSEGVTFYHLTSLSETRYSYHFSASDGVSWNSTSNVQFYTVSDEKEDIDFTPLLLGFIVGAVVVCMVYVLRVK